MRGKERGKEREKEFNSLMQRKVHRQGWGKAADVSACQPSEVKPGEVAVRFVH